MPFALLIALAASLGIHAAALFGPTIELTTEPESLPLLAELRPLPKSLVEPLKKTEKVAKAKARAAVRKIEAAASPTPVLSVPEASRELVAEPEPETEPEPSAPIPVADPVPPPPRLPPRGIIHYRVDYGDRNFEIGKASSEWEIIDGAYRLSSVTETSGLVWLFKPYRITMESRGRLTDVGLKPESFSIKRNGVEAGEKASFDWEQMLVRVGDDAPQIMIQGTQDLLSFNYQLGFMPHPEVGSTLPIATGRKYGIYRLEVLGDEDIEIPAGVLRTLHVRAPGVNTTELWLAYDYLLLPVKIRFVDNKGDSLVQVATAIQLSPE
jgi:hypothetical protein